jgi:hypothetical protein
LERSFRPFPRIHFNFSSTRPRVGAKRRRNPEEEKARQRDRCCKQRFWSADGAIATPDAPEPPGASLVFTRAPPNRLANKQRQARSAKPRPSTIPYWKLLFAGSSSLLEAFPYLKLFFTGSSSRRQLFFT